MIPLRVNACAEWSIGGTVIAGLQVRFHNILLQITSKLTRATGVPAVVITENEVVLGEPSNRKADDNPARDTSDPAQPRTLTQAPQRQPAGSVFSLSSASRDDSGRPTDMNASLDTIAEQMLTLVEIVSAQENDIKALKEQCRKLEEHDQAIAVAFTTFFHVLSAGRVAKLGEIASILNHITRIAEQEGRPPESVKFLRDLAGMLPDEQG
jgi:hypothetical protein